MTALACAGARLPVSSYTNAMDSTALSAVVHRAEMGPDPAVAFTRLRPVSSVAVQARCWLRLQSSAGERNRSRESARV